LYRVFRIRRQSRDVVDLALGSELLWAGRFSKAGAVQLGGLKPFPRRGKRSREQTMRFSARIPMISLNHRSDTYQRAEGSSRSSRDPAQLSASSMPFLLGDHGSKMEVTASTMSSAT